MPSIGILGLFVFVTVLHLQDRGTVAGSFTPRCHVDSNRFAAKAISRGGWVDVIYDITYSKGLCDTDDENGLLNASINGRNQLFKGRKGVITLKDAAVRINLTSDKKGKQFFSSGICWSSTNCTILCSSAFLGSVSTCTLDSIVVPLVLTLFWVVPLAICTFSLFLCYMRLRTLQRNEMLELRGQHILREHYQAALPERRRKGEGATSIYVNTADATCDALSREKTNYTLEETAASRDNKEAEVRDKDTSEVVTEDALRTVYVSILGGQETVYHNQADVVEEAEKKQVAQIVDIGPSAYETEHSAEAAAARDTEGFSRCRSELSVMRWAETVDALEESEEAARRGVEEAARRGVESIGRRLCGLPPFWDAEECVSFDLEEIATLEDNEVLIRDFDKGFRTVGDVVMLESLRRSFIVSEEVCCIVWLRAEEIADGREAMSRRFARKRMQLAGEEEAARDALREVEERYLDNIYAEFEEKRLLFKSAGTLSKEEIRMLSVSRSYGSEFRWRMLKMARPPAGASTPKPFIGFSLGEFLGEPHLRVEGLYECGPAYQVGIRIGDVLLSIEGKRVTSIAEARHAVLRHCHTGRLTDLTLQRPDGTVYAVSLWVMTAEPRLRDEPYFFDIMRHKRFQRRWQKETIESTP
ncbi:kinetoplast DNA-associated protein [Trypanosoma grayi]|uniref:kinetoplast DNA-associated protein n=1 Tax=Trypanosoma grayi TaxID=71804 RepID=UPI0004F4AF5C|nr:kinetoplast DNA-associated protein [Trypanosoma grayi]KEG13998.1 kinetoplast DNA-associated protein [Trypanosoma grayi]